MTPALWIREYIVITILGLYFSWFVTYNLKKNSTEKHVFTTNVKLKVGFGSLKERNIYFYLTSRLEFNDYFDQVICLSSMRL